MGAWNLALETRTDDLDLFVLLSSISSLIGNPGQGSYDAANAFLDGLAHHLRARGVPALAVNLGAVAGVGAVARDSRVEAALRNAGIEPVAADEIFVALESVLRRRDAVQVGLMRVDWRRVLDAHPALGRSGRFERLADAAAPPGRGDAGVRGALLDTLEEERPGVLRTWLRERAVGIMGVTGGDFPVDRPLTELGLDSMMAGELAAQMERELSVSIPMVRLLQGPSLDQLADQLLRQLAPSVTA
jgi:acyl carrier protein